MFRSDQHHFEAGRQPRTLLVACLAMALAALSVVAWWQQVRIRQLSLANVPTRGHARPGPSIRRLHGPRIVVAPARSARLPTYSQWDPRRTDPGLERLRAGAEGSGPEAAPPASLMADPEFLRAFETYREGMLDARYA